MADKSKLLVKILKKIPIFDALPPSQVKRLVSLCEPRALEEGDVLCHSGTPSDEMYILLAGELSVTTGEGHLVATLSPVTTVGEMGVITGQPRSATVTAVRATRTLVLKRERFESAIEDDTALSSRVMRNFIEILAHRVGEDNVRLREFEQQSRSAATATRALEQRVRHQERRAEAAMNLLVASGGERDTALAALEDRVRSEAPRVLVVDDEPDFRDLVRRTLSYFAVSEAQDGEQALSCLDEDLAHVVVTDIRMPGMDGIELATRLKERYPDLPVVGVSGFVGPEDLEDETFLHFASKPIAVGAFRALVEEALARSGAD